MKVAVADVAHDGGGEGERVEVGAGVDDAIGEPGDGHADIGGEDIGAGAQGAGGVVDVVAGLPEAFASGGGGLP